MITLEDRLHDTGNELRRAATRVPDRGMPDYRRTAPPRAKWAIVALAIATLVALPIWFGAFGALTEDPAVGGETIDDIEILRSEADVVAFLDDTVIELDEALHLVDEIREWEGVARVAYVSRALALIEYREMFADQPSMVELVESDPSILPGSIRLVLTDGTDAETIGARLQRIPGVLRVAVSDRDQDAPDPETASTTSQPGDFRVDAFAAVSQSSHARGLELQAHSFQWDELETVLVNLRAAEGSVGIELQRRPFTPISDLFRSSPSLERGTIEVWPEVGEALITATGYPGGVDYRRSLVLHTYDGLVLKIHAWVPAEGALVPRDAEAPLTFEEMRSWAGELLELLGYGPS